MPGFLTLIPVLLLLPVVLLRPSYESFRLRHAPNDADGFRPEYVYGELAWSGPMVWIAIVAILAGSVMALGQAILRMLTYLIIAEVGYMVGGAWL